MTPNEYEKNIHVRLSIPLIMALVLALMMTILSVGFVYSSDNLEFNLYGNYDGWVHVRTIAPIATIIIYAILYLNLRAEPEDPRNMTGSLPE